MYAWIYEQKFRPSSSITSSNSVCEKNVDILKSKIFLQKEYFVWIVQ